MKVVIDKAIPFIEGRLPNYVEAWYLPSEEITSEVVKDADAIIVRTRTRCDSKLLEGSKVKLVATATIGTDHIDMDWCSANGIEVRNAPGCNAPGVAQYVWSSLLRCGFDPGCHTLGIIGYGHVGSLVGAWAKEMGIKTLVCDPPRQMSGYNDVKYLPMDQVLRNSDAVTLHVPFTTGGIYATRYLVGYRELDMMKPGALLINSSRGGVVNELCLKDSLREKGMRAVVDVWENEPLIDAELLDLVAFATPHIAGYSQEGKKRATAMALKALKDVMGVEADITGLECVPANQLPISSDLILRSYDPTIDSDELKSHRQEFEYLRNNYKYRHEPLFQS